jgi:hypothetical protein
MNKDMLLLLRNSGIKVMLACHSPSFSPFLEVAGQLKNHKEYECSLATV